MTILFFSRARFYNKNIKQTLRIDEILVFFEVKEFLNFSLCVPDAKKAVKGLNIMASWLWDSSYGKCHIHFNEYGKGCRHVVLLHGLGANGYTWRHLINPLSQAGFHVWVIDLAGFGESDKPHHLPYCFEIYVELLHAFLKEHEIVKAHFVGHSMGGGIALGFVLTHGPFVNSLTLIDAAGYPLHLPRPLWMMKKMGFLMKRFICRLTVKVALQKVYHQKEVLTEEVIDAYWKPLSENGGKEVVIKMLQSIDNQRLKELSCLFSHIMIPTLVLWGRNDRWIPVHHGYRFFEVIPNARLVIIEECGHVPHEEQPEKVNLSVLSFLEGLEN